MLPSNIKIGPFSYPVEEVGNLHDFDGDTKVSLWGMISHKETRISLLNDLSDQRKTQVLWHEIVHGIINNAGISEHDETLIDAIATGMLQVVRDNPELIAHTQGA